MTGIIPSPDESKAIIRLSGYWVSEYIRGKEKHAVPLDECEEALKW